MFYLATPIGDASAATWQPDHEAMKENALLADFDRHTMTS
jgi:hypothetical protein